MVAALSVQYFFFFFFFFALVITKPSGAPNQAAKGRAGHHDVMMVASRSRQKR